MSSLLEPSVAKPLGRTDKANKGNTQKMYDEYLKRKRVNFLNQLSVGLFIAFLIIWSWYQTSFDIFVLFTGIANITRFIFMDLLPPDLSVLGKLVKPALDTLMMSYVGVVISISVSLVLGFMTAKNTTLHPALAHFCRAITAFLRSVPALIWGIILVATLGLGAFAGTLALGLSGIGILGKAYAETLEELDQGQIDAVRATGANWLQVMGQGVWPQFRTGFVAWSLYKFDINIREAAMLGIIGAGGIGYALQGSIKLFQYKEAATAILIIFVLILLVEFTTSKLRGRLL